MKALPLMHFLYSLTSDDEIIIHFPSGDTEMRRLRTLKKLNRYALVSFFGINDPETALKYRGAVLSVDKSLLPVLPKDEYFHDQIIGLTVQTTTGDIIGRVADIFETGSNDVYVVKGTDRDYLLPAIHDVIRKINLKEGRIIIQVLEGLLD
jgi:16S rRNA processing protein RimM